MRTPDVLRAAADLISKPGAWTQRSIARNGNHEPCGAVSVEACSWCAIGAIWASTREPFLRRDAQAMAEAVLPENSLSGYNDAEDRTAEEVVSLLRSAATEWERADEALK